MRTLELHYGGAVSGNQKFDRPELEARFVDLFNGGSGIKMFGLRRIGKSTLRLHLHEELKKTDCKLVFIDGQGLHSLAAFLASLSLATKSEGGLWSRALQAMAAGPMKEALLALDKDGKCEAATLSVYWQHVSTAIKTALATDASYHPVLIVDEFSYLIQNMVNSKGSTEVDLLLGSMREWREAGMRMLLTGSIGVTQLARRAGLNLEHLNDLQPFTIPELTEAEAQEFIEAATIKSEGRWTPAHTQAFLEECSVLYPCFIVKGLQEVGANRPVPHNKFAEIFEQRVRPHLHADFYEQFNKRFRLYGELHREEQCKLILPALKAIMEAQTPVEQGDLPISESFTRIDLDLALGMLVEDGFVDFTEDRDGNRFWKPGSRLARVWWKRARLA